MKAIYVSICIEIIDGSDLMLDLEENSKLLETIKEKIKDLGESL